MMDQDNLTEEQKKKVDAAIRRTLPQGIRHIQNKNSHVKRVVGVMSGKGGVGKSLVTSLLAVMLRRRGYKTAILDADITGPSIPRAFGLSGKAGSEGDEILPVVTKTGIRVMSVNLLMDDETQPVLWRGPVISGAVRQFWTDVRWGETDIMLVDMPPGTGDVPLTVFQMLPVDGVIVVTSPQGLVEMIVEKAVHMAQEMHIPVLGFAENMSYYECPDCGKRHEIFGKSRVTELAGETPFSRIPVDPDLARLCDAGEIESVEKEYLREIFPGVSGKESEK